jgi:enoyl-CoA hydratase
MGFQSDVLTIERGTGEGSARHVATLWLDNEKARNAMGAAFWNDLPLAFAELGGDADVRAVVVAAKGKHFSAGIDLQFLNSAPKAGSAADRLAFMGFLKELQAAIAAPERCPKPVIAAVQGACIGGGLELVGACDIRLASADATFSLRETRMGIVADLGALERLPKIVGTGHAAELIYTGKDIDAARAERIGLVNDVHADHEAVVAAAQALGADIASNSPLAVQGSKALFGKGLDDVAVWNAAFMHSEDLDEAVAAFFEKRPPEFRGR